MADAKARLRARLKAHDYANGHLVPVYAEDLRQALRELGELRQRVQEQAKGIRHAQDVATAENRTLGRVFANVAAAESRRRCMRLERALTTISGPLPPEARPDPLEDPADTMRRIAREALLDDA